ncbi:PapD-like protein [Spinellus fusiger]|nr:PapD-like protein [Spinellus fusiger]
MSLRVEPSDRIVFERPLTRVVHSTLRLHNDTAHTVAFKVKTTAPRQYCVRPNAGLIVSDTSLDIQVMFQPLGDEPPVDYKCRDKFLVQSVSVVDALEGLGLAEVWSTVESTQSHRMEQKKLRCIIVDSMPEQRKEPVDPSRQAQQQAQAQEASVCSVSAGPQGNSPATYSTQQTRETHRTLEPTHTATAGVQEEVSEARETILRMQQKLELYEQEVSILRQRKEVPSVPTVASVSTVTRDVILPRPTLYLCILLVIITHGLMVYYMMYA